MEAESQQTHQVGGTKGKSQHHHRQHGSAGLQDTMNDLYTRINTVIEQYGGYGKETQKSDITEEHFAAPQGRQARHGSPVKTWNSLSGNRSYTFVGR